MGLREGRDPIRGAWGNTVSENRDGPKEIRGFGGWVRARLEP
jgi:hypothetical protein